MTRLPAAGILHVAMSEVLVEQNDLEAAETHLTQGIELGKWSGRLDAVKNAAHVLSRMRLAKNDMVGALAAIREAETALVEPVAPLARADLLAFKARVYIRQGAVSEAAQCVEAATRLAGKDRGQTQAIVTLAACRVLLAQHKPEEALAQLSQSLTEAEASGRRGVAIELRILRCLTLARLGKTQEATRQVEADLECLLAMAEPEGYVRIFLDEGVPMQLLLAQWLAHAGNGSLRDFAIRLLAQFAEPGAASAGQEKDLPTRGLIDPEDRPAKNILVDPLSQRELEVLHLMALGRTNQEIARQLIVAPGTIKAHAASIYRKLDVANRTEAVARARQLGLLP
jgi:LuxR family maltose regulon positive regulatory protein